MRKDLNKQLCERERFMHRSSFKDNRHDKDFNDSDYENLPSRESMRLRYMVKGNNKEFNENLNPLYGAVHKAVGKRWDRFYSELCKVFDKRSVVNEHILQHLFQHVCTKTKVGDDGQIYVQRYYNGSEWEALRVSSVEYYVDPRDNILRLNKYNRTPKVNERLRKAEKAKKLAETYREIDGDRVLRKIDGIWFVFEMAEAPQGEYVYSPTGQSTYETGYWKKIPKTWDQLSLLERQRYGRKTFNGTYVFDAFLGKTVYFDGRSLNTSYSISYFNLFDGQRGGRYHKTKKTASSKLLKQHGLKD